MTAPFIDVRNARAYVSRKRGTTSSWTHEPCANWQQLEDMAAAEVARQGGSITLSGIYPCSADLAALALWAEDVLAMTLTTAEAAARFGMDESTVKKAAAAGRVYARKSGGVWLVLLQDAERLWADV